MRLNALPQPLTLASVTSKFSARFLHQKPPSVAERRAPGAQGRPAWEARESGG